MRQALVVLALLVCVGCCKKIEVVAPCPPPPVIERVPLPELPPPLVATADQDAREVRLIEIIRALVASIEILQGEVQARDLVLDTYRQAQKKSPPPK